MNFKYRSDIDGLRALAVLAVVFFHADIPFLSGGYVGVDIFFVISGYLITKILIKELNDNSFSVKAFWMRRIRRILPVSIFILIVALIAFYFVYPPGLLLDLAKSAIAQTVFLSNVYFWMGSGYFDTASELKPLLHNWSLSIEEQYYLFYPILLAFLYRFLWGKIFLVVFVFFISFFLLSTYLVCTSPGAAFYFLPSRAWELAAGGLVALLPSRYFLSDFKVANFASLLSVFMMLVSFFIYDNETLFPGPAAVLPVLGAVLFIYSNSKHSTLVFNFFSLRPIVQIGLMSYSLYLWHWVVIVFYRAIQIKPPGILELLIPILASFFLSWLSYQYIEKPTRFNKTLFTNRRLVILMAGMLLIVITFSTYIIKEQGLPNRFVYTVDPKRSDRQQECFENFSADRIVYCSVAKENGSPKYLSIGDSHNLSFLPVFEQYSKINKKNGLFAGVGGCLPFIGVEKVGPPKERDRCLSMVSQLDEIFQNYDIETVFMVARWTYYTEKSKFGSGEFAPFVSSTRKNISLPTAKAVFREQYIETVKKITEYGAKVVVVAQVPHQYYWPEEISVRSQLFDLDPRKFGVEKSVHVSFQQETNAVLKSHEEVKFIDLTEILCDEVVCKPFIGDIPLYYDDDHLSMVGSQYVIPQFLKELDQNNH